MMHNAMFTLFRLLAANYCSDLRGVDTETYEHDSESLLRLARVANAYRRPLSKARVEL